ncbi:CHAT domain-containing protein [Streptomyces sp. Wh19]|uniref:CHAT domain-containing protein n=1 Tax=Streptomyces sp. Wh19 TaxID=3076629 RepID=UPI0029587139|nr:CHAT domain-containing protein [Streptomyces sp. Wh19]MDV9196888.1 hypothetical protein [Streptomyces sp. Wh19]
MVSREAEAMLDVALGHCLGTIEKEPAEWRELGKTHLCIRPHGPLHYAPFHLLHSGGRPLADEWTISILPGLSALSPQDGGSPAPVNSGLLAIGSAAGGTLHGLRKWTRSHRMRSRSRPRPEVPCSTAPTRHP